MLTLVMDFLSLPSFDFGFMNAPTEAHLFALSLLLIRGWRSCIRSFPNNGYKGEVVFVSHTSSHISLLSPLTSVRSNDVSEEYFLLLLQLLLLL